MDFTGVYHKASEQMCYPLNEDELIVNLKTGYDVKRVFIYYGDPFEAGILGGKEQWAGFIQGMTKHCSILPSIPICSSLRNPFSK